MRFGKKIFLEYFSRFVYLGTNKVYLRFIIYHFYILKSFSSFLSAIAFNVDYNFKKSIGSNRQFNFFIDRVFSLELYVFLSNSL